MPSGMYGRAYQVLEQQVKPPSATSLRHRQIQADIFAGALAALLVVVFNVIIAGVVFTPGDELSDSMSNGVVLAFVTTCSTGAVMLLLSPLPIVTGGDVFLAAMYGREMKPALLDQDEPFATLVVAMAMCSLFLGVTFWALGAAQAGKLVQFLPSPVMQGYLAAMGYVMIDSAAAMTTGCGLLEVGCLQASPDALQLAVAMVLGVALYVAQRLTRGLAQTFLTPALLLLLTLGFALLRAWLGDEVLATGTMNVSATPESAWRALLPVAALGSASWQAALQAAVSTASVVMLPVAVGRLLGISAIESRGDVDVDYNRELRVPNAVMYLVQGTVGFMPCGTSVVSSLMMRDLGGTTKLAPLVALVLFVATTFGVGVVGVVPKVGFAMIMCNAGLSTLLDNVRRAWAQLSTFEFAMVLLHVALTVTFDLLSAVVLGLLFTAASFIVEYSRHSGVLQRATLQLERSKVLRAAADHAAIDAHGAAVFIVHLHGMIFFGSANSVVEAVRGRAYTHALSHCRIVALSHCRMFACRMCMCMLHVACSHVQVHGACACVRALHARHAYAPCMVCPMRIIHQHHTPCASYTRCVTTLASSPRQGYRDYAPCCSTSTAAPPSTPLRSRCSSSAAAARSSSRAGWSSRARRRACCQCCGAPRPASPSSTSPRLTWPSSTARTARSPPRVATACVATARTARPRRASAAVRAAPPP